MPSIASLFLTQLGVLALSTLFALPFLKWFGDKVVARLIDAKVDHSVKARLAASQFEFDKQLAGVRSDLDREVERLRSALARQSTDFGIWANRRHDATAALFADFLRCELKVTDLSAFTFQPTEGISDAELAAIVARFPDLVARQSEISRLREAGSHDRVDDILERSILSARKAQIVAARNEAYEAYYRSALYLSDAVDAAAQSIRDHFHKIMVPYLVEPSRGIEFHENRERLRGLLVVMLQSARADLGRAAGNVLGGEVSAPAV